MSLKRWGLRARAVSNLLVGRSDAALANFNRMLEFWSDDAYALSSRCHLLAQASCREAALADARRLVQLYPQRSAGDWFNLAYLLDAEDSLHEAEAAFQHALALDPKLDRGWYGLGLVLMRQGRYADAVAALERNTELQPMSPFGWYQLARVHMDHQEADKARKIIRHLKGFEPQVAAQLERETGLV